jgi:DNA-binding NarL/FixJ family response regulator
MIASTPVVAPVHAADLLLARRWRREGWLLWLHWADAAACPLLIPCFPGISPAGALLLGFLIALGASAETWLRRRRPTPARLRAASALATAIEWQAGLGVIALAAYDRGSAAPGLLLILLILTAARYGVRGVAGGTVGAALAIAALVLVQAGPLGVLAPAEARDALRNWGWLIGGLALTLALLLGPDEVWPRPGRHLASAETLPAPTPLPPAPSSAPAVPAPRRSVRLSEREVAVLALLLRREDGRRLPRKELARRLSITEDTVKTHMRSLARKLGAEDASRDAIVRAAQRHGLADSASPPADDDT